MLLHVRTKMPGKDLAYSVLQALEREESMYKHIDCLIFKTLVRF